MVVVVVAMVVGCVCVCVCVCVGCGIRKRDKSAKTYCKEEMHNGFTPTQAQSGPQSETNTEMSYLAEASSSQTFQTLQKSHKH